MIISCFAITVLSRLYCCRQAWVRVTFLPTLDRVANMSISRGLRNSVGNLIASNSSIVMAIVMVMVIVIVIVIVIRFVAPIWVSHRDPS